MYASCATLSPTQKYFISIDHNCCRLTVLFAMPTVVAFLQCTGVRGWGWPNSSRVSQKNNPFFAIEEESTKFSLGHQSHNKMKDGK
jgi:hypothetical protein